VTDFSFGPPAPVGPEPEPAELGHLDDEPEPESPLEVAGTNAGTNAATNAPGLPEPAAAG
jgi:hypothetical protein